MLTNKKKKIRSKKNRTNEIKYPHISSNKNTLSGIPIINGTRTSVKAIACYYQMGMSVDEILNTLTHLTPSQIHSALAYYFDHQSEINLQIRENIEIYDSDKR